MSSPAAPGRVVIVGASLAGLRAAETLRREGFRGELTLIGDEPHEPYDRPPLSKQVLAGRASPAHTALVRAPDLEATWLLGEPAAALDPHTRTVTLAGGREIGYDRLLIATGTRARPWPAAEEAALDGVFTLRGRDDAERLRAALAAGPRRVLVIGGGFTGSEIASVCRELGLPVTLAERGPAPLSGALGAAAGSVAARMQRAHGVDLRANTTVMALEGDGSGRLRAAYLSDGDVVEVDVAVVALGAVRNTEWLAGSGLAADARGVVCDAACRAFDADAVVTDDVYVAGDVARWPHPHYDGLLLAVEHWDNAVRQAETAAANLLREPPAPLRPHRGLPAFWSYQFGVNIKSVGLPTIADEVVVTQGAVADGRFVAAYGRQGRTVAAVAVDSPRWLPAYAGFVAANLPFPPDLHASDAPDPLRPVPAGLALDDRATHSPTAAVTGDGPTASDRSTHRDPRSPLTAPPL
ncbi:NAD(P)/FAD-dependent oxidoreductase [Nonomuraea pusilla]|uniref:Reductase C-terminal n=1 Tax=Nonomuraea pusilla TaxID=46177 RepID=A0A1H7WZU9_9ACTN|nr:FAD-dependent oxidoreductase [Nonomuraea pusilla]SEM26835.1 Reductase C-terminal [Nonomuraea pusilla]